MSRLSGGVEAQLLVLPAAEQHRHAEHEQHVADDRSGQRGLHDIDVALAQRDECEDQFRGVAKALDGAGADTETLGQLLDAMRVFDDGGDGSATEDAAQDLTETA